MAQADGKVTEAEFATFHRVFGIPAHEEANVRRIFNLAAQDVAGYEAYAGQIAGLFRGNPAMLEDILDGPQRVDVRSFGVRCPPTHKDSRHYGILAMMHVLSPALGWLWRLVAPRGHANPSIQASKSKEMQSEGVGSYWAFATGRRVDQANLLLDQILNTPDTRYVLIPNQHIGGWKVGFMAEWIAREYLARRGSAKFSRDQVTEALCPLLG